MEKLNLGCGKFPIPGYLNIDLDTNSAADKFHNLNEIPFPFEDESFVEIRADHILEHLHAPFDVMKELNRILKPGGKLVIRVPHFSRGYTHPEHKRGFDITFSYYFNPKFQGGYTGVKFNIISTKLHWAAQMYLKKLIFPWPIYIGLKITGGILDLFANICQPLCSRIWCFWFGGFEEIEFVFQKPSK